MLYTPTVLITSTFYVFYYCYKITIVSKPAACFDIILNV